MPVVLEDGTELEKTVSFADKMLAIPGGLANFVQSLPEHVLDATGTITTHREVVLAFLGQANRRRGRKTRQNRVLVQPELK